jgi:mRNA interferase RelE/StbE
VALFEIVYRPSVEKDLAGIQPPSIARILRAIKGLASDPFPRQAIQLKGTEQLHRVRVGNYRIVYRVDAAGKRVVIEHVRHRRDVYRNL